MSSDSQSRETDTCAEDKELTRLLKSIVSRLVDHEESLKIESIISSHSAVFDIHVCNEDVGKLLGRRGAHADALRTLFGALFGKNGKRLNLQVVAPRRR